MLKNYQVREGFHLHREGGGYHPPKSVVQLSDEEAKNHLSQIQEVASGNKQQKAPDTKKDGEDSAKT